MSKKNLIVLILWQIKPHIFKSDGPPLIIYHFKVVKFVAQKLCHLTFSLVNKLKSPS